jgi:hypothetical protein
MTTGQSVKIRPTAVVSLGLLAASVATGLGVAALEISRFPVRLGGYFVLGALWAGGAVILLRRPALRDYALALLSIFLCLAGAEAFFFAIGRPHIHRLTRPKLIRMDPQLGYSPVPGARVEEKEFHDDKVVYDVVYTIAADDLRQIPGASQAAACRVAFFGCSFAFGQGLNDDQTVPYYFVRANHGRYEGFNFAFGGYGPHQMLRQIETGQMAKIVERPNLVIYEAIPDHVRRLGGYAEWDRYGPRYVLEPGGSVRYAGPFHRHADKLAPFIRQCWTCRFIAAHVKWRRLPADVALFTAVVSRARDLIERRDGARFLVVLWDDSGRSRELIRELDQKKITVYRVTEIIPDLKTDRSKYVISPFDLHPNATANRLIGEYLARAIGGCA